MLSIIVLGTAAGGGVPQWNCGCDNCCAARTSHAELRATQASIAISADQEHWFLINASPDLRQQLTETPALHPRALRHSPVAGVILTNGEVDAIAGLLTLREGAAFNLYGHRRVLDLLDANPIFNVLKRNLVPRRPIEADVAFEPQLPDGTPSGLEILPFVAPGKAALFVEDTSANEDGDTLGFVIRDKASDESFVFLAACAALTPAVETYLRGARLVFFDGTLFTDDEMIRQGLSQKTGRRMGHMAMAAAMPTLENLGIIRKIFLHINNSNPALMPGAPERQAVEQAGWQIPADGMEITL
ncbi:MULTISPECIES: pyrroloquinoline quinone biosynthesis protein PqqB [unclassified Devosia]|jgi:pyrroloquinoline quinone biosynthesis protein B|uniref:pyrroloquinoline quinone biosynthesis protein PqqB n=1 Tax=unclassified Devosia TaxID=196773 RepID=UPI0008699560|nr:MULTISPECIES: pyrroloquinoline quinone biosynthesis protein PqqB [unclassified Devosia]MBN9363283.1 pyrroloquinoline quinone biosynthesis protein PqqB [Devosia sp.]ODS91912.1 MAG: pyrroloquinoline quinone biosynthesis protein PqqB [Devosia sp. SCN 66-27]OJX25123.1 MAG: pyrroloquinoline quinone biosynthesis protein PqqB [Devosia sp. 66-14]